MVAPWRLCQRCCCRYGCFPLLVIPIITFGCFLSFYSSAGCKFVDLDIGFAPTNQGFDATAPYSLGPLFYFNESVHYDSMYREALHSGCVGYSEDFVNDFIVGDRTFKMIRIMTLISCGSSALAMFVSWIFLISPIPVDFLWAGVLLPAVMVAFITEGSKFLIFDTALCRSSIWYRGSSLVPEKAENCSMGDTAWFACAAGILHFWALVCVCLRAPERRTYARRDGPPPMKMIAEGKDEDILEETTEDNGIVDDERDDMFLKLEAGDQEIRKIGVDKVRGNKDVSKKFSNYDFGDIMADTQCATDLTMGFVPINDEQDDECCSPMSTAKHAESPEAVPDVPTREAIRTFSPVDCIIEGFDVATDLSQIDVCRTMLYSPTRKPLEIEAAVAQDEKPFQLTSANAAAAQDSTVQNDTTINRESVEMLKQCQAAVENKQIEGNACEDRAQALAI